jgi:hypothetical protein
MPSKELVGVAPLLTGIVLAFQSGGAIVQGGFSLRAVPGFVGGCAAIVVGFGILLGRGSFELESTGSDCSSTALLGLAAVAFLAGVALATIQRLLPQGEHQTGTEEPPAASRRRGRSV